VQLVHDRRSSPWWMTTSSDSSAAICEVFRRLMAASSARDGSISCALPSDSDPCCSERSNSIDTDWTVMACTRWTISIHKLKRHVHRCMAATGVGMAGCRPLCGLVGCQPLRHYHHQRLRVAIATLAAVSLRGHIYR
jgi:hypothetical protein